MTVAIVVPCYNEAARWRSDYWDELLALPGVHWTFVDDGSTDGTPALLERTCADGRADLVRQPRNAGKGEAVRIGLLRLLAGTETDGVGFMDADGAFACADVAHLATVFHERTTLEPPFEAVWSARVALAGRDIRRSPTRHYIGRGIATLVSIGTSAKPYDTQSGLKLFAPGPTLRTCLQDPFRTRWLFELELLARWEAVTTRPMRIWEEPLGSWVEPGGSHLTARETARVLRELAIVKQEQARTRRAVTR